MRATIILFLLCLLTTFKIQADAANEGKISYCPVVKGDGIPNQAVKSLIAKMEQVIAKNGFGASNSAVRFVMLAKCNVIEKDVAPTTPPRITQIVELTFILGDAIENKTYASISFELKGIGTNETKVWQTALNGLKPENTGLKDMFEIAETKIDTYYSENCRNIIAMSNTLSASGRYDEAIASLMAIPDICSSCYADAMSVAQTIYQLKINDEGTALLSKAKNAWNANPDEDGAMSAICLLDQISINSSAFPEAEAFSNTIASKLSSDKEREWQQKIKQYNDEKTFRDREQANSHARSMATIAACRSVAEKWTENQPQNTVYLNW